MATLEDDEYEIPLRDQRYFGAGIKRKRIQFVPSTTTPSQQSTSLPAASKVSAADRYLEIVLGKSSTAGTPSATEPETRDTSDHGSRKDTETDRDDVKVSPLASAEDAICDICNRPIASHQSGSSHESTIAHQLSLPHSHPPSDIDRRRKGFAVLNTQGWDPDSRLGLGAEGEGMRQPIKPVENPDRAGLGAKFAPAKVKEKPVKLDAGKIRMIEKEGKKKADKLRNDFYARDDVLKYLGEQGDGGGELPGLSGFGRQKNRK